MINISIENGQISYNLDLENKKTDRKNKGKSLLDFPDDYVVIDIETTGLSPEYDSIIEVAALRVRNGEHVEKFETLIKPTEKYGYDDDDEVDFIVDEDGEKFYYINSFIVQLTGITNKMLHEAPTIDVVLPRFQRFVGNEVVVGHNVNFDINFLYDNFINVMGVSFNNNFIDTMRISRRFLIELNHHRLKDISKHYSIESDKFHRAEKDCFVTNECFVKLKQDIKNKCGDYSTFLNEIKSKTHNYVKAKDIQSNGKNVDISHPLYGKKCVFTGALEKMKRKDAMQIIANFGGLNQDNITTETNYLILGNNDYCSTIKDGKSIKQKKAEKLKLKGNDIDILPENVFYDMIDVDNWAPH